MTAQANPGSCAPSRGELDSILAAARVVIESRDADLEERAQAISALERVVNRVGGEESAAADKLRAFRIGNNDGTETFDVVGEDEGEAAIVALSKLGWYVEDDEELDLESWIVLFGAAGDDGSDPSAFVCDAADLAHAERLFGLAQPNKEIVFSFQGASPKAAIEAWREAKANGSLPLVNRDPFLRNWVVLYREADADVRTEVLAFTCKAEDRKHAEEQCEDANADCHLVWAVEGDDPDAALAEWKLYASTEPTNEERAERIAKLIPYYMSECLREERDDDNEKGELQIMLADVMHFCDVRGFDFERVLNQAHCHHDAERDEPAEPQPAAPLRHEAPAPGTRWYVVVGRAHGDNEASSFVYEMTSKIDALCNFASDMIGDADPAFNVAWARGEVESERLYLDAVYVSNTPIDELP